MSHIPVLLAETLTALQVRDGGLYLDGTFGAGGYTRALLARGARVVALDRDPTRHRRRRGAGRRISRAAAARRGALRRARPRVARDLDGVALDIGVSSMQLDRPSAASRCASTRRSTCGWKRDGRTAADILRRGRARRNSPTSSSIYGEERAARRIARAIVADRDGRAVRLDAATRRPRRPRRAGAAGRAHPSRDARVPGAAHRRQRRTRRTRARPRRRRARAEARRAARGRDVPFARGPHRQAVPRAPLAAAAAPSRGCCRASRRRPRPSFRAFPGQPVDRRARPSSPPIRARVRPSCASPSAPTRRPVDLDPAACRLGEALMWRLLHLIAIAALIGSAVYVYGSNTDDSGIRTDREDAPSDQQDQRRDQRAARRIRASRAARPHPGARRQAARACSRSRSTRSRGRTRFPSKNTQADSHRPQAGVARPAASTPRRANGAAGASPATR